MLQPLLKLHHFPHKIHRWPSFVHYIMSYVWANGKILVHCDHYQSLVESGCLVSVDGRLLLSFVFAPDKVEPRQHRAASTITPGHWF